MSHLPNVYAIINIADLGLINFSEIDADENINTVEKGIAIFNALRYVNDYYLNTIFE